MPTISLLRTGKTRLLLYLGSAVTALGLGVGAWMAARPRTQEAGRPAAAARRQGHAGGKVHFDVLAKLLADDRRSSEATDWLRELAHPKATFRVATQSHPLLGHRAPHFTLRDHRGLSWSLPGQRARGPVVLVFYLGYTCNACVHDLFELNADLQRFRSLGAEVVAVSGDALDLTRLRFKHYGAFRFPVLSDPGHALAQSFGVFRPATRSQPEKLLHGTFLIGHSGQVQWARYGDAPFRNNKALLYELARLEHPLPQASTKEPPTP